MSDYRGAHQAAVAGAQQAVNDLLGLLGSVLEVNETTLAMIVNAVGETEQIESAANALAMCAEAKAHIEDAIGLVSNAGPELDRYAGGF